MKTDFGTARLARQEGVSGTKKSLSCPAINEVLAQSMRKVPVRKRGHFKPFCSSFREASRQWAQK
jgi:hypothetical protein